MWSVQKKVTALLVVAVMVAVVLTKKKEDVKFRFKIKQFAVCSGKELTIALRDLKTSSKQKGKVFVVNMKLEAKEDTDFKTYSVVVYRDGLPPIKLISFDGHDFCAKLKEGKAIYLEPTFASGQIPRQCTLKKGVYPLKVELDLVVDGASLPDAAKGRYNYKYKYGDGTKDTLCVTGYADIEQD